MNNLTLEQKGRWPEQTYVEHNEQYIQQKHTILSTLHIYFKSVLMTIYEHTLMKYSYYQLSYCERIFDYHHHISTKKIILLFCKLKSLPTVGQLNK